MSIKMEMSLSGHEEVGKLFQRLTEQTKDFRAVFYRIVAIMRRSINQTFTEGGRPERWPPRWEALYKIFPNLKGKNVLKVSGRLRQSTVQSPNIVMTRDTLIYAADCAYAAVQQFGGPSRIVVPENKRRTGRNGKKYVILSGPGGYYCKWLDSNGGFTIQVRPRPFMQIFPEDVRAIGNAILLELRRAQHANRAHA